MAWPQQSSCNFFAVPFRWDAVTKFKWFTFDSHEHDFRCLIWYFWICNLLKCTVLVTPIGHECMNVQHNTNKINAENSATLTRATLTLLISHFALNHFSQLYSHTDRFILFTATTHEMVSWWSNQFGPTQDKIIQLV